MKVWINRTIAMFLALAMSISTIGIVKAEDTVTSGLTVPEEGKVILSNDFNAEESLSVFNIYKNGGTVQLFADDEVHGNTVEMCRTGKGEFRLGTDKGGAPLTVTSTASSIVYELDIKLLSKEATNFNVYIRKPVNGSNKMSYLFRIEDGKLKARNGAAVIANFTELAELEENTWYKISVVQDYEQAKRSVYLNGTLISENIPLDIETEYADGAADVNLLRVECAGISEELSESNTDHFLMDNLCIYEGKQPVSLNGGDENGSTEEGDKDNETKNELRPAVWGTKIFQTDFESNNPFSLSAGGGSITRVQDDDTAHGMVVTAQRLKDGNLQLRAGSEVGTDASSVVYEFDLKLLDAANSNLVLWLRKAVDGSSKYSYACYISEGKLKLRNGYQGFSNFATVSTLEEKVWYRIALVQNYETGYRDVYVDGVKVSEDTSFKMEDEYANGTKDINLLCFEGNGSADYFMLDNIRVYEGTKPYEGALLDKEYEDSKIEIDTSKSVFEATTLMNLWGNQYLDELLTDFVALHVRSGVVYQKGTKTILNTEPIAYKNGYLVVLEEICSALHLSYTINADTAVINSSDGSVTNKEVPLISYDNKNCVNAEEFLRIYGVVSVNTNDEIKSNGMLVAGNTSFEWPSAENQVGNDLRTLGTRSMLQNLNEYLLFEQPTADTITKLYAESETTAVHPRIQATKSDFEQIQETVKNNMQMNSWYQQLIATADYLVDTDTTPLKYEFRDGVRLLYVSRDMLEHMYTLGMAYQLTGEQKYVERAWIDLEAVSDFEDWHPQHALDTGEMAAAVAIGYDWMYDALTKEQREKIEKAVYRNCFKLACDGYQDWGNTFSVVVLQDGNQNIVINSGIALSAMAFMDVYPEECAYMTSGAIRAIGAMLVEFGPDGAWKEGTTYWEYTMQYASKLFSTLDTVFGTCFSLDKCEGLDKAAKYILDMQSDCGLFNYGDASATNYYVPEIFYLSNKYGDSKLTSTLLSLNHGEMLKGEDIALSLLWYDTNVSAEEVALNLDGVYWTEGVASFRDKWTDGATAYVGIHGGKTNVMHAQIDGGTFVYDYAGIRWAKELGSTPYNTSVTSDRTEESGRWKLYKSRAEAHNTLVINPDDSGGQKIDAVAKLIRFESDNKGAIAVMNLTENYADYTESAIRGFFFTDDRTSLVVRDEINLIGEDNDVYWFMQTDAAVTISEDGRIATLTQDGKQVYLEFEAEGNGTASLEVTPSTRAYLGSTSPLKGTSEEAADEECADTNRVVIAVKNASGAISITVKLTPAGVNASSVDAYTNSIESWKVAEGEIAAKPTVEKVLVNEREIEFDDANQALYLCVEGTYDTVPVPDVSVDETKYTYEIQHADTLKGGVTTITVKDKNHAEVYNTYTIVFEEIPVAVLPEGYTGTALQVIDAKASAEPEKSAGNVAWKVLDQDTDTKWTSQGMGNWIILELEKLSEIDEAIIWFTNSHARSTYFNISISTDGENYTVVKDNMASTILDAEGYEGFKLNGVQAKYIKIGCNGNSKQGTISGWNNIKEVVFSGSVTESETPTPTPTPKPTPEGSEDKDVDVDIPEDTMQSEATNTKAEVTSTGDNSNIWLWSMLFMMAIAEGGAYVIASHKKFSK